MRALALLAVLAAAPLSVAACASSAGPAAEQSGAEQAGGFEQSEIADAVADYLGVSAEAAGSAVERIFRDQGKPNAYIYGEEAAGAIGAGLRYGAGTLVTKDGETREVKWQGPSIGWDLGGNASKSFTLVYNLSHPDMIYRRYPGVEGSAYLIGGLGVNYQRAEDITLAPIRAGVGARLGANVGYLSYSKRRKIIPF